MNISVLSVKVYVFYVVKRKGEDLSTEEFRFSGKGWRKGRSSDVIKTL